MGKSFIEASTEIGDIIAQRSSSLRNISNILASFVMDRVKSNKIQNLPTEVNNLLDSLSDHEKYHVVLMALTAVAKSVGANRSNKNSDRNQDDIFNRFR